MKLQLTFLIVLFTFSLSAQSIVLDSLISELGKIEKDTARVDALIDQAWSYRRTDPEVSIGLLQYLEKFEQEHDFRYREDVKWYYFSLIYKEQANFEESEANILKYIDYQAERKDTVRMVFGKYALSNLYYDFKMLDKSMKAAHEVLDLKKDQRDTAILVNINRRIGTILAELEQFEEAMKYHKRAKEISLKKKDYYLLADVYNDIGLIFEQTGPVDSTLFYYNKYLELAQEYGTEHQQLYANYNLGAVYSDLEEYRVAEKFFQKSMELAEVTNSQLMHNFSVISLADMKTKIGNPDEALVLMNQMDTESQPANVREEIYQKLYAAHYAKGNFKEAVDYHQKYKVVSDTLLNRDVTRQISELNIQYESDRKDQEIITQQLELRNSRLLLTGLGGLIGIGGLLFLLWNRKQRYKAGLLREKSRSQELEIEGLRKEKQLLSMTSILQGQEEERRRIARDLHDNIGSMMAAIKFKILTKEENTDQLDQMVGQVSEEIRRISHNMTPLAFGLSGLEGAVNDLAQHLKRNQLEVVNKTKDLHLLKDKDQAIMVYRLFQEMANNTLKHSEANRVFMSSRMEEEGLSIEFRDDGKGLPSEVWEKSDNLGLKNIKSRVDYLDGSIEMDNSNGTEFHIQIPKSRI